MSISDPPSFFLWMGPSSWCPGKSPPVSGRCRDAASCGTGFFSWGSVLKGMSIFHLDGYVSPFWGIGWVFIHIHTQCLEMPNNFFGWANSMVWRCFPYVNSFSEHTPPSLRRTWCQPWDVRLRLLGVAARQQRDISCPRRLKNRARETLTYINIHIYLIEDCIYI